MKVEQPKAAEKVGTPLAEKPRKEEQPTTEEPPPEETPNAETKARPTAEETAKEATVPCVVPASTVTSKQSVPDMSPPLVRLFQLILR